MIGMIINILAILFGAFFVFLYIYRAAVSGITYDEAFTYLAYSRPLEQNFSLEVIRNIYYESLANNHWINTIAIALTGRLTGIEYCEFVIRIPSMLFGVVYVITVTVLFIIRKLPAVGYSLLICGYYLNEFFGLARGYGQAAVLVFIGIILYEKWRDQPDRYPYLTFSLGFLIASAYANSVSLVVCFSLGIPLLIRLIKGKRLWPYVKKSWPFLLIYLCAGLMILKYHFKISAPGLPLYYSETNSLFETVKEYVGMIFTGKIIITIFSILLIISFTAGIVYLAVKRITLDCDLGLALIIYMICILLMNTVFKRGGFLGRTLLPAFTLFVIGIMDVFTHVFLLVKEKLPRLPLKCLKAACTVLIALIFICFFTRIDPYRTSDWYEDYDIKINFHTSPELLPQYDHASTAFYAEKDAHEHR